MGPSHLERIAKEELFPDLSRHQPFGLTEGSVTTGDVYILAYFKKNNPSAEHIARYIYGDLSKKIKAKGVKLARIKVAESRGCWAVYSR